MTRQMSAERSRRAVVTEALGNREAAVTVAEGQKQAAILKAEGDRQAAILRAEGFSLALERIYQAASQVDQKTMALQYLEAFKALGQSPSTKYILPLEVTQLADSFRGFLEGSNEPGPANQPGPAPVGPGTTPQPEHPAGTG
jgi:regulator of protease activity HflC (stomatin/prohibitin superfamily)